MVMAHHLATAGPQCNMYVCKWRYHPRRGLYWTLRNVCLDLKSQSLFTETLWIFFHQDNITPHSEQITNKSFCSPWKVESYSDNQTLLTSCHCHFYRKKRGKKSRFKAAASSSPPYQIIKSVIKENGIWPSGKFVSSSMFGLCHRY